MPFRLLKRRWTSLGEIMQSRFRRGYTGGLLITRAGKNLLLNYRRLLRTVRVESIDNPKVAHEAIRMGLSVFESGRDRVVFSKGVRPKPIGDGAHGMVFLLSPSEERAFSTRKPSMPSVKLPSVVLKVYRGSIPEAARPNGFSQFVSETAVYNFLKKRPASFVVRPLHYYFVSNAVTVRRFINAPTLEELRESMFDKARRRKPLSMALSDAEIDSVAARNRITTDFLDKVQRDLSAALAAGAEVNFNLPKDLPVKKDPSIKNVFIFGRDQQGRAIISVIDQGIRPLPGVADRLAEGTLF